MNSKIVNLFYEVGIVIMKLLDEFLKAMKLFEMLKFIYNGNELICRK